MTLSTEHGWLQPDWPAPNGVTAFSTTRVGGISSAPYDSLNLGLHVGDAAAAVLANRTTLASALGAGAQVQWLDQVHGVRAVQATRGAPQQTADACWTREPGLACAVMTADCLPVLFTDTAGTVVAAAHAGWRGLQAGILEATVAAMAVAPGAVLAWLGPAIGPQAFEVGAEVRDMFLSAGLSADEACFVPNVAKPGHYFADLYGLARLRLLALGVVQISGGEHCTMSEPLRFFSYRRSGQTGRMASVIMLKPQPQRLRTD